MLGVCSFSMDLHKPACTKGLQVSWNDVDSKVTMIMTLHFCRPLLVTKRLMSGHGWVQLCVHV